MNREELTDTTTLTETEFKNLINNSESTILDFKSAMYDLSNKKDMLSLSKFIKDIICFSNTIRTQSSFIILGISELENGKKELIGLEKSYDDSIFQDKVKDKVYPRPNFLYYQLEYKKKLFGIFEFPLTRYTTPISPVSNLKGLEAGRIYYRRGTTNSEAIGQEVIRINDWLRSIPENNGHKYSLDDEVTKIIGRLSSGMEKLSVVLADLHNISKKYNLKDLVNFCSCEIVGMKKTDSEVDSEEFNYRIQPVIISYINISLNPYSSAQATSNNVKNEMKKNKDFMDYRMFFPESVSKIEETIQIYKDNPKSLCSTITTSAKKVFPNIEGKDYPVYVYTFPETYEGLYSKIRQKTIDKLMQV